MIAPLGISEPSVPDVVFDDFAVFDAAAAPGLGVAAVGAEAAKDLGAACK